METLNLRQLTLILDQDIVILQEDVQEMASAEELKSQKELTISIDENISTQEGPIAYRKADENHLEEKTQIRYEGNFEKAILIVFKGDSLKSSHRNFLVKVLEAVACSLNDVALISSNYLLELPNQSIEQLDPVKYLVFGELDHPIMQHKTSNYEIIGGETNYFFADNLEDLEKNIQLKRNLWNGLQVLFQIKK